MHFFPSLSLMNLCFNCSICPSLLNFLLWVEEILFQEENIIYNKYKDYNWIECLAIIINSTVRIFNERTLKGGLIALRSFLIGNMNGWITRKPQNVMRHLGQNHSRRECSGYMVNNNLSRGMWKEQLFKQYPWVSCMYDRNWVYRKLVWKKWDDLFPWIRWQSSDYFSQLSVE